MKKFFFTAAVCLLSFGAKAQGFYVGASLGPAFKAGSAVLGTSNDLVGKNEVVAGSYGAGFVSSLNVGYFFSKSIGTELGIGYLMGNKNEINDDFGNSMSAVKLSANSFYLNPSIIIKVDNDGNFAPYAKFGMFLGLVNSGIQTTDKTITSNGFVTSVTATELELKGNIATGVTSALGMEYKLTEKFFLFGEVNGRLATWSPATYKSTVTTTPYFSGTAQASTTTNVSGAYEKEIPVNYTGLDLLAQRLPFSAIGLSVGVKYYLK